MVTKERSFGYKPTYEGLKGRVNSRGGGFDTYVKQQYKMYKVKDGKNLIRIMPPRWDDAGHYGLTIYVNFGIGPDNQSYLSLSKMLKKRDPLAEARAEADRADNEEVVRQLQPKERVLMWIIDREDEESGPQLWAAPKTVDQDICSLCIDDDNRTSVIDIVDKDEGRDLRFHREGKGINTKYPGAKMRLMDPSPLHEDSGQQKDWLNYITENPIPETLNYYDYDHIAEVFNGHSKPKDEAEDDVQPRKAKAKPADAEVEEPPFEPDEPKTRRTRPVVNEDDETEIEERPARRKRAAASDEDEDLSIGDRLKRRREAQASDDN